MRKLFLLLLLFWMSFSSLAATFYRHVPFKMTIHEQDQIHVEYDFAAKLGVQCSANKNGPWLDYRYKGRAKSGPLPVILQNTHIPPSGQEELADIQGVFAIYIKTQKKQSYEVKCDYVATH